MAKRLLVALAPANALGLRPNVLYFFAYTGCGGGDSASHPRSKLSQRLPDAFCVVEGVALVAIPLRIGRLVGALGHNLTIP
jgi:hypothetical protein